MIQLAIVVLAALGGVGICLWAREELTLGDFWDWLRGRDLADITRARGDLHRVEKRR